MMDVADAAEVDAADVADGGASDVIASDVIDGVVVGSEDADAAVSDGIVVGPVDTSKGPLYFLNMDAVNWVSNCVLFRCL